MRCLLSDLTRTPKFIEKLSDEIPDYIERLGLKPGLTGPAQVINGYDNNIESFRRKVAYRPALFAKLLSLERHQDSVPYDRSRTNRKWSNVKPANWAALNSSNNRCGGCIRPIDVRLTDIVVRFRRSVADPLTTFNMQRGSGIR